MAGHIQGLGQMVDDVREYDDDRWYGKYLGCYVLQDTHGGELPEEPAGWMEVEGRAHCLECGYEIGHPHSHNSYALEDGPRCLECHWKVWGRP